MSLINEALKKAQRQRTEEPSVAPPSPMPVPTGGVPMVRVAKHRPPMPARTQVLIIIGSAAVLLMGGAFAFIFLIGEPAAPPPPVSRPVVAVKPAPVTPVPVTPATPVKPAPPATPTVALTLPESPAERNAAAAIKAETVKNTPKPVVPQANPQVYEFLDALRITGIRISDTDPKVIMNDRVFRLNDLVDRATGLRLTQVDSSTLIFVDSTGYEYRKNF